MKNINTPEELLNFMSNNINYGYLGNNGRVYHFDDSDFDKDWYNKYVLQSHNDLEKNLYGTCFDQVEFEREWFFNHNFELKTFFVMLLLDYENYYPTHSFLAFKDKDMWCWFENSDYNNRGIHRFNSLDELLNNQLEKQINYLKTFNASDEELNHIIIREFNKPKSGISASEYLDYVIASKEINIKNLKK